jgi:hypothetical protein
VSQCCHGRYQGSRPSVSEAVEPASSGLSISKVPDSLGMIPGTSLLDNGWPCVELSISPCKLALILGLALVACPQAGKPPFLFLAALGKKSFQGIESGDIDFQGGDPSCRRRQGRGPMCAPPILPDETVFNAVASHDGAGTGTAGQVTACGHKPCLALDSCSALSAKRVGRRQGVLNHDLTEPCCLRSPTYPLEAWPLFLTSPRP